ncbi:putative uncharacterized protein [Moritella viscosa]|nr:hypothetical protein [Moritella viscosa]CED61985.1 putative uncharacterized protein [Moritella viscosa]SHO07792.1 Putative uncharacterized protein [Moritella viscosa]
MVDTTNTENINSRSYRSTPIADMVTSNPLTSISKWKYVWQHSGVNRTCNFEEFRIFAEDEHVRLLISKFECSGWSNTSKVTRFDLIKNVLKYAFATQPDNSKSKVVFSPQTIIKYIHATYSSMMTTGKGLHGKPITVNHIGRTSGSLRGICDKFGLGKVPQSVLKIRSDSAVFDSDNYTRKTLVVIARSLLEDRKALLHLYQSDSLSDGKRKITFDRLISNAMFLTIYYLGTGQTETLSMFLEEEWRCSKSGAGRITIEGIKTRGQNVELRTFTPRASCKAFFDSHLSLSKAHSKSLGLDKHYLFKRLSGKEPSALNLRDYVKYLMKNSARLQVLKERNPDFSLNCNLLKSSIKQLAEQKMGRKDAAESTRNAPNTYDAAKYGTVNKGEARTQLSIGLTALENLGKNPDGGSIVAVAKAKKAAGKIISNDEWNALKVDKSNNAVANQNGGFCEGHDTPQKREFGKKIDRNSTLSNSDKSELGCGFVIKCFSCSNFGLVDEPHDIWRFLSFEKRLNEAMAAHQNVEHFIANFGEIKANINNLKSRLKKRNLNAAMKMLEREYHPLWDDEESIKDIFRG